jgi:PleD family two-component response regulator
MYALIDLSNRMLEVNDQLYTGLALSFSPGAATSQPGERLEAVVKRADPLMYEAKRAYYAVAKG